MRPRPPLVRGFDCLTARRSSHNFALLCISIVAALALMASAAAAPGHRHRCHLRHTCPSDHHTYAWRGLVCTSYPAERVARDKIVRRSSGHRYWCHR